MSLLALAIDLNPSVSDTSETPIWNVPSFDQHEEEHFLLYSELIHATFRQWSPKLALASDDVTLRSSGWRMQSVAVKDPNSWNPEAHFEHLVACVVATQPDVDEVRRTTLAFTKDQSEAVLRENPHVNNLSPSNRLARAKRLLEERFSNEMALLIETEKESPFENEEIQRKLHQHFGQLVSFVFKDRGDRDAAACEALNELQVTAQQFLLHLKEPI